MKCWEEQQVGRQAEKTETREKLAQKDVNSQERAPQPALLLMLLPLFSLQDPVAQTMQRTSSPSLSPQTHSVAKFLHDVFASPATAKSVVFETDIPLLLEVIQRELTNRDSGDPVRDRGKG